MNKMRTRKSGYTVLEIMGVVAVIGLLSALAMPAFLKSRRSVQNTRFINDLRVAVDAFEQHAIATGVFPPSAAPGVVPAGMDDYLSNVAWDSPTPLDGQWVWDNATIGNDEGVSIISLNLDDARAAEIDAEIDDGNLGTGLFRKRATSDGFIFLTGT